MLFQRILDLPLAAWIIAFLFFIKASILALWIVPLWDIPDETRHFAYARDIASGKGILPLGKAEVDADIMSHLRQSPSGAGKNGIVQHPPLYHIVAGAVWKCATFLTDDPEWLFRAPRLVSAFFGAATLLFIFKIIESFSLGVKSGLAVMVGFSAIPMFSWLSAGTNHDTMVALFGCASAYYFVDFFRSRKLFSAYMSAFLMSLAAATKMTALVALVPLVGLIVLEIPGNLKQWLKKTSTLMFFALAVPGIWLVRNFIEYGNPFATAVNTIINFRLQDNPLEITFIEFLRTQPAIEHFFVHFFGLIGWAGVGFGSLTWFQIRPPFLTFYTLVAFFVAFFALIWFSHTTIISYSKEKRILVPSGSSSPIEIFYSYVKDFNFYYYSALVFGLIALLTLTMAHQIVSVNISPRLIIPLFGIIFLLFSVSLIVFVFPIEQKRRLMFYALFILAFFSLILLWQVYNLFLLDGRLRATHGRYFYPVLGMIVIGFVVPALLILEKFSEHIALPAASVVLFTEAAFYFVKVLPFTYGEGFK